MRTIRVLVLLIGLLGSVTLAAAAESPRPLEELRVAAEKGDPAAQFELALYVLHGRHPEKPTEVQRWMHGRNIRGGVLAGTVWLSPQLNNPPEAVRWLRRAADQGYVPAYLELGSLHLWGVGVPEDDAEALKWFRRAADEGDAEGHYLVGRMTFEGRGVAKDDAAAARSYRLAAEKGHSDARYRLAEMLAAGTGVTREAAEAKRLYTLAAEQGHFEASFKVKQLAAEEHFAASAGKVATLRAAAERGSAQAQYELASVYSLGQEAPKDEAEAVRWLQRAVEQGYVRAMGRLAHHYHLGQGVARDEAAATEWYRKAAELGDADAQGSLGVRYAQGTGVARDDAKAVEWLRRAAEQGDEAARAHLGYLYLAGHGVAKDLHRAAHWFRRLGPKDKHGKSAYFLGVAYEDDGAIWEKVAYDPVAAYFWYRVAVEEGDQDAQKPADQLRSGFSKEQAAAAEALLAAWKAAMATPRPWGWSESVSDARVLLRTDELDTAERCALQALQLAERERRTHPLPEAESLELLAGIHVRQKRDDAAPPLLERAVAIRERHQGRDHPDVGEALAALGRAHYRKDDYARAEPLLRRALAIRERRHGEQAPEVADLLDDLGRLHYFSDRDAEAVTLLKRAYAIRERTSPEPDDYRRVGTMEALADVYASLGQYAQAEPLYLEVIRLAEEAGPLVGYVTAYEDLASVYERQKRYPEAEALMRKQLTALEALSGPAGPALDHVLARLADLARSQDRLHEAEALLRRALAVAEAGDREGQPAGRMLGKLGAVLVDKGDHQAAVPLLERALAILDTKHEAHDYRLVETREALMKAYASRGDFERLDALVEKALTGLAKQDAAQAAPAIRLLVNSQGDLYFRHADPARAETLSRQSLDMQARVLGSSHPELLRSLVNLASLAREAELMSAAVEFAQRACRAGQADGCVRLGIMHAEGEGVEKDMRKAVALYRQGCEGGSPEGCNNLGVAYGLGEGVEKDSVQEAAFVGKACEGGLAVACHNLAWLYEQGEGLAKDPARAAALYRKACEGDFPMGCQGLGSLYARGLGVGKDPDQALTFYRKACEGSGGVAGCNNLAYHLAEQGRHLDEALAAARKALAAQPKDPDCQDTLGWVLYKRGDYAQAERHIRDAVTQRGTAVERNHLGDVLLRLGRKAEAIESWKSALAAKIQDHDDPGAIRRKIDEAERAALSGTCR